MITRLLSITLLLAGFLYFSFSPGEEKKGRDVEVITLGIENFWKAYDAAGLVFNSETFKKLYFDTGTPGVKDFIEIKIGNAQ